MAQARIGEIRAKEKSEASEAVKMSKKMKKNKGKSNGKSTKEPSFSATKLFDDIHRSLQGTKRGLVDLMASYEAALEEYDRFGEVFMCLISARTGILRLEADHDSAASQLENLETGDPELEAIIEERSEQLQGLVGDAHTLIEAMGRSLLKEFQGFEELAQFMSEAASTLAGEDRQDSVA